MNFCEFGRRIYYEKNTKQLLVDTGEKIGIDIQESSIEDDFEMYLELKGKNPEAIGVIQLEFGEYREELANGLPFTIDRQNNQLIFDYSSLKNKLINEINNKQQEIQELENKLNQLSNV